MDLKRKQIVIGLVVIAVILIITFIIIYNMKNKQIVNNLEKEIVPEEEISDEQLRETTVSLFYVNANNEVSAEIRKIDSKILMKNPYYEVMNLLLKGPKSGDLKNFIPENVRINSIEKKGECIVIDFSKEFIENQNENVEYHGLVISQIVNTMTQFTEINAVKILIDGEENKSFKNGNISFKQVFTKED